MNCQEVIEFMQRYIDEDLNQQEKKLMMDHVGECPDCATMLVRLQKLSSDLTQLPRVVPRYSLVDAILPELERLRAAEPNGTITEPTESLNSVTAAATLRSNRPRRHLFRNLSGIIAAGVVAGLLIFYLPQNGALLGGGSSNEAVHAPMANEAASEAGQMSKREMSDTANASEMETSLTARQENSGDTNSSDSLSEPTPTTMVTSKTTAKDQLPKDQPIAQPSADQEISPGQSTTSTDSVEPFAFELRVGGEEEQFGAATGDSEKDIRSMEQPSAQAPMNKEINDTSLYSIPGIASVPAEASLSPDGHWRAIAVTGEGTIQVYKTADESRQFISEPREGIISLLSWNDDNTLLYYTYTDAEGHQLQYVYDVVNNKESIR